MRMRKGDKEDIGNKVNSRALMVVKYFSGMGVLNGNITQRKSAWSIINALKFPPKFPHALRDISEGHFIPSAI